MVDIDVAVLLSEEELKAWTSGYYYLPIVGVKSKNKPLRVCFDASRKQCGSPSMNDCLFKELDHQQFVSSAARFQ